MFWVRFDYKPPEENPIPLTSFLFRVIVPEHTVQTGYQIVRSSTRSAPIGTPLGIFRDRKVSRVVSIGTLRVIP